ncbi:MAG: AmmeMemoRadiSam system protein B [Gammaproteobacteria bacterium]|nr:AmmeMemoRadiSam system protein B [Gammaproteobacteria bacterium]
MSTIRKAAVAGSFYADNKEQLAHDVIGFLNNANANQSLPKAIIAPHAGYIYSGPIAASAYACLKNYMQQIKRVVLIGPAHRCAVNGLAFPSVDFFATPLGSIKVDKEAIFSITKNPAVIIDDEAHAEEHCLEVQLPFLQILLKSFSIVPILVGQATPAMVSSTLEQLWDGKETLIIISSDLSHYYKYSEAQRLDEAAVDAILNLDMHALGEQNACGRLPIKGLLQIAKQKKLIPKLIDLRNSGDTAGSKDQVVGYGAFHFYEE